MIVNYFDENKTYNNGDKVWACNFSYFARQSVGLKGIGIDEISTSKPEVGKLMNKKYGDNKEAYTDYFVPFKSDGETLDWDKAVRTCFRKFTDTRAESIRAYNNLIKKEIVEQEQNIRALKEELL